MPDSYERVQYKGQIKFEKLVEFLKKYSAEEKFISQEEQEIRTSGNTNSIPRPEVKELTGGNFENEILSNTNGLLVHFYKDTEHGAWEDSITKFEYKNKKNYI